ncbi:MAG: hypothetical protein SWO11_18015 [Thermodesulfobacteriota bacterium]|nr:hypothetical protein [Thermodesulfobacteriota bacterium]
MVGTEIKNGPLWSLKNLCHSLFRNRDNVIEYNELLFDWILGSIFHECMKLKEDIYQLEAYRPIYCKIENNEDLPIEVKETIREYEPIMKETEEDVEKGIERIFFLFSKASLQLKKLLPNYSKNALLIKYLIDDEETVINFWGEKALNDIFDLMFQRGIEEAYCLVCDSLLRSGWQKTAVEFLMMASQSLPDSKEIKERLSSILQSNKETIER